MSSLMKSPPPLNFLEPEGWELANIECVSLSGRRIASGASAGARFDMRYGHTISEDGLLFQYGGTATLQDEAGVAVAIVECAVVVILTSLGTRTKVPEQATMNAFAKSAILLAHPYMREHLQDIAARLGYLAVTLPMLPPHAPIFEEQPEDDLED